MAVYTVKIDGVCTGGEHIRLSVYVDGKLVEKTGITRTELLESKLEWKDVLPFFLRQKVVASAAKSLIDAKTAIEAVEWEM